MAEGKEDNAALLARILQDIDEGRQNAETLRKFFDQKKYDGDYELQTTAFSDSHLKISSSIPSTSPPKVISTIRYDWSQTDTFILLALYCKSIQRENCIVHSTSHSLVVNIIPSDSSLPPSNLIIESFFALIDPKETSFVCSSTKVDIQLKKHDKGYRWMDLIASKETSFPKINPHNIFSQKPSYPSSSKTTRDWDSLSKTIEEEITNDSKEGDEALNELFKEIYAKGDENTRRAMVKSFQTSCGTVLSTNWDEVKTKEYEKEISAPEGQEFRKA
ncbi:SGS domain-containing protein [Cardiosporidium cionae]|uniref:SGS domain-containing protein n=1 Tax=Cardiosporidium cionae TaxID=476202 RepID=A0ABQ7J9S6_9APIC|nr:SGS domain-containing protein [Cardiosporidium cionae]|eukprot:KAF8820714.1 SGS domain-containing protein [Cardiosporidium cionae]